MTGKINHCIVVTSILFATIWEVNAQQKATTEDGREVILKEDGTWEYATPTQKTSSAYNFRETTWGMNREQVRLREKAEAVTGSEVPADVLGYKSNLLGLDCLVAYIFTDEKLVRGKYVFVQEHSNKNDYIQNFAKLKESLVAKYGKPKENKTIWRNRLYDDDYEEWGLAISIGHLVYYAEWETAETGIALVLNGENYKISLVAEYQSKKLKAVEDAANKKKALEKL